MILPGKTSLRSPRPSVSSSSAPYRWSDSSWCARTSGSSRVAWIRFRSRCNVAHVWRISFWFDVCFWVAHFGVFTINLKGKRKKGKKAFRMAVRRHFIISPIAQGPFGAFPRHNFQELTDQLVQVPIRAMSFEAKRRSRDLAENLAEVPDFFVFKGKTIGKASGLMFF